MRRLLAILLPALLTMSCARRGPEDLYQRASQLDWAQMPRVPSPDATAYASGRETPRDPLLYKLLDGFHYDGALAAAASSLALAMSQDGTELTRWELREAAWRGGWPYPVDEARSWRTWTGSLPPRDLVTWLESLPDDMPMALVRARGRQEDVWVGLRSKPPFDLGAVPRIAGLGTPLPLPPVVGATYTVADSRGSLQQGALDEGARLLLQRTGEWLVLIRRGDEDLARFPIYVDTPAPSEPVLRVDDPPPVTDSEDADAFTANLLDAIRDAWSLPRWERSPIFGAAVRAYVQEPSKGSKGVLAAVGYEGAEGIAWACDDVTVQNCIDQWLWDPRRRAVLLSGAIDSYGLDAVLDDTGVHLTLLLVDAR